MLIFPKGKNGEATASLFYLLHLASFLTWWSLIRLKTGTSPWDFLKRRRVAVRPSWMSRETLLRLHRVRREAFIALPLSLGAAALVPSKVTLRIFAAITVSLYHVIETSSTGRHGEYPLLYSSWGWVLGGKLGCAVNFGVCIHFILSTGFAKIFVGGLSWLKPGTMREYLKAYGVSATAPPLSKSLNRFIRARPWALVGISAATLLLELIVVPSSLIMPPAWRPACAYSLIVMHFGIAWTMSLFVGIAFLTTLPTYVVGFSCDAPFLSLYWNIAAIGLLPTLASAFRGKLAPENWPLSSCALFMWGGDQAKQITNIFMSGDTRLVIYSCNATTPPEKGLLGKRVIPPIYGAIAEGEEKSPLHDAVLRIIGYTLVRGGLERDFAAVPLKLSPLLQKVADWLQRNERIVELSSGSPCRHCALVRIDANAIVSRVIMHASASKKVA